MSAKKTRAVNNWKPHNARSAKTRLRPGTRGSYDRPNYLKAGEWIFPTTTGFHLVCCGCGLTHTMDFAAYGKMDQKTGTAKWIKGGSVAFRVFNAGKWTKRARTAQVMTALVADYLMKGGKLLKGWRRAV